MAKKSKSLNPADAFRKAQRQKEIKRNKLDRKKARETAKSKKDSKAIEVEIRQLEKLSKRTQSEQNRLEDLKKELSSIIKAKEQHGLLNNNDPNNQNFNNASSSSSKVIIDPVTGLPTVSDSKPNEQASGSNFQSTKSTDPRRRDWFGPDGKLLEPERSVYYDPVFNPFGVPPPGMPLRMKPVPEHSPEPIPEVSQSNIGKLDGNKVIDTLSTKEGETKCSKNRDEEVEDEDEEDKVEDEDESDEEEDKDEEEEEEDDDIPLPDGSPPPAEDSEEDSDDDIPLPEGPPPLKPIILPPSQTPTPLISRPAKLPRNNQPHAGSLQAPPPPPFLHPPILLAPGVPPPPIIAGMGMPSFPLGPNGFPIPPPPPLANLHLISVPPSSANLPPRPITAPKKFTSPSEPTPQNSTSKPGVIQSGATVTALPKLRDLKREATSFVPSAIRKKRKELDRRAGLAGLGSSNRIQAAPDEQASGEDGETHQPKQLTTSLLGALRRDGVVTDTPVAKTAQRGGAEKDDYEKFVESLGDVL